MIRIVLGLGLVAFCLLWLEMILTQIKLPSSGAASEAFTWDMPTDVLGVPRVVLVWDDSCTKGTKDDLRDSKDWISIELSL